MDYNNINYHVLSIVLGGCLLVAFIVSFYLASVNADLKAEVNAKNDIIQNLFEQNATLTELTCTYAKVVGGPQPEICLEG